MGKKIYLAGKINKNDWRHEIVNGLGDVLQPEEANRWPILPNAIMKRFDYVGPFFIGCDHGCFHGENQHGLGIMSNCYDNSHDVLLAQAITKVRCTTAIIQCDLFFVWLDSTDAYGTLVELGIAHGLRAMGRQVKTVIASDRFGSLPDLWFAISGTTLVRAENPKSALAEWLDGSGWMEDAQLESPLEELFWSSWRRLYPATKLAIQYHLGAYRLDFAHPSTKTAIELDGITYHGDKEAFERDRRRDRALMTMGWQVLRFTGDEIRDKTVQCAEEVISAIARRETSPSTATARSGAANSCSGSI